MFAARRIPAAFLAALENRSLSNASAICSMTASSSKGFHNFSREGGRLSPMIHSPASVFHQSAKPLFNNTVLSSHVHKRGMFIQTQTTPNPASVMFIPGKTVMESGSFEAASARAAMASPLATKLFVIDGVDKVFFGSDFVTVTKKEAYEWSVLKPDVFAAIMDFYSSGQPLILEASDAQEHNVIHEDDDEIVAMIKELLETRIRPAVQEDGGDIQYKSFDIDTGLVIVRMVGACSGCPSSSITLKSGIENMLMHYIPEVKSVVQEEETNEEILDPLIAVKKEEEEREAKRIEKAKTNPLSAHLSN